MKLISKLFLFTATIVLLLGAFSGAAFAQPDEGASSNQAKAELSELLKTIEQASDDYYIAIAEHDEAEKNAADIEASLPELEEKRKKAEEALSEGLVSMYKRGGINPLLEMFMKSSSLEDIISSWTAYQRLCEHDAKLMRDYEALCEESESKAAQAREQSELARQKAEESEAIRRDAEAKVAEYEQKLASIKREEQAAQGQGQQDQQQPQEQQQEQQQQQGQQQEQSQEQQQGQQQEQQEADEPDEAPITYSQEIPDVPADTAFGQAVVEYAKSRIGCPYVWGSYGPDSFDCCGLTSWCYKQAGLELPPGTRPQYDAAKAVLPLSQAQPGDVLYMQGHVGIYAGGGMAIHAPSPGEYVEWVSASLFDCALRF